MYDVSSRADLYGISGPYSWMAGRDASVDLAKMRKVDAAERADCEQLDGGLMCACIHAHMCILGSYSQSLCISMHHVLLLGMPSNLGQLDGKLTNSFGLCIYVCNACMIYK